MDNFIPPGSAPAHLQKLKNRDLNSSPFKNPQLTPKTTAAQRFQARYFANSTPNFSPKKRLDFEVFAGVEDTVPSLESSPKLKRSPDLFENHGGHGLLTSSSSVMPPSTPNSSRTNSSYHQHLDESGMNSSRSTIKPISLASKFDCFSDSD